MLRACLVAADTLEAAEAIRWIEHWLGWFEERAETAIEGVLTTPESAGARIETLYFDGPGTADWVALAQLDGWFVPALDSRLVLIPQPVR